MPHAVVAAASLSRRRPHWAARRAVMVLGAAAALLAGCAGVSLDEPLEGTPWRLVQLQGQPLGVAGGDSGDAPPAPRLQFDAARQQVSGSGGCNRLSGGYRRSGSTLRIGPLASTRMACPDAERSALETRFVAALEATAAFDVKGAQLTLLDARALPLAVLELGLREAP